MRKLVLAALAIAFASAPAPARAEGLGIGIFVGEPLGLDLKIALERRSSLDIVLGATSIERGRESYGHLTYLYTLAVARGRSVLVPLRIGIGGAIYGISEDLVGIAARAPFEVGLRFRRSPIEIYGEIAFLLQLVDEGAGDDIATDITGGVGIRFFF
jgi:hypothetical protein